MHISEAKTEYYHISTNPNLTRLVPRVPINFLTENGLEDNITPRVSVCKSIDMCLRAIGQDISNTTYFVYKVNCIMSPIKPSLEQLSDVTVTNEHWFLCEVEVTNVGSLKTGIAKETPIPYSLHGKTEYLYDWNYTINQK